MGITRIRSYLGDDNVVRIASDNYRILLSKLPKNTKVRIRSYGRKAKSDEELVEDTSSKSSPETL